MAPQARADEKLFELIEGKKIAPLFVLVDGGGAFFRQTLYITPFGVGIDWGVNLEGSTPSLVELFTFPGLVERYFIVIIKTGSYGYLCFTRFNNFFQFERKGARS